MVCTIHTEIAFELRLTENQVMESTDRVQLNVIRSGQFNEIYTLSVEYRISTNGSSIARGIKFICEMIDIIIHVHQIIDNELFFYIEGEDFQLRVIDDTQQITFTTCDHTKDLTITITDDTTFENDENIDITLINVILTQMEAGSNRVLNLSEEERRRLLWNMAGTTVTILDDDGMLSLIFRTLILHSLSYI